MGNLINKYYFKELTMDKNAELLNYVYQNAQMGVDTITQLTEIVQDRPFLEQLRAQLSEYQAIYNEAIAQLDQMQQREKGISNMQKITVYLNISLQTLTDKTPSHIAEMMMQGSSMGIIDATKRLKQYQDADPKALQLGQRLLKTEQNNFETLKQYL